MTIKFHEDLETFIEINESELYDEWDVYKYDNLCGEYFHYDNVDYFNEEQFEDMAFETWKVYHPRAEEIVEVEKLENELLQLHSQITNKLFQYNTKYRKTVDWLKVGHMSAMKSLTASCDVCYDFGDEEEAV